MGSFLNRFFNAIVNAFRAAWGRTTQEITGADVGDFLRILGILVITASAGTFFFLLGTASLDAALTSHWPPLLAGLGSAVVLVNTFTKVREGADIIVRNPQPDQPRILPQRNPWAVVLGIAMYFVYMVPIHYEWWERAALGIPALLLWVALIFVFLLYASRTFTPGSLYWGFITAWGSNFLYWGLFATAWAGRTFKGTPQTGVMAGWVTATVAWLFVSVLFFIVGSVIESHRNKVLFNIDTAMCKALKLGSMVSYFIADLTGVPHATQRPPANVLRRGHEAVWAWMLAAPASRMDIRPFLTNWGWIGPAFGYYGIPYFTQVIKWKLLGGQRGGHDDHGVEFADIRVLPNIDSESDQVPAGPSGVELSLKVGVVLQLCNPYRVFSTPDLDHTLEHAIEQFVADVARTVGTFLYGFTGDPELLARGVPALAATTVAPLTNAIPAQGEMGRIIHTFVHHLNDIGYHVVQVIIKDVNIGGKVQEILLERVHAHVQRAAAEQRAETMRLIAEGQLNAFMQLATQYQIGDERRGEILGDLAKLYFLQGGADAAQALGLLLNFGGALGSGGQKKVA